MKICYLLFLGAVFSHLNAQNTAYLDEDNSELQLTWGNDFKDVTNSSCIGFIGEIAGSIYALKSDRKSMMNQTAAGMSMIFSEWPTYYIDKLDENMNLVYSAKVNLILNGKKLRFERAIIFGDRLFILTTYIDEALFRKYLYYQELDTEKLSAINEPVKIGEIVLNPDANFKKNKILIEYSPDKTKLLVLFDLYWAVSEKEHFSLHIFDSNFTGTRVDEVELPYSEKLFQIETIKLDNSGNIYVLGKLYFNFKREKQNGAPNYKLLLLQYEPGKDQPSEYEFNPGDVFLREISVLLKENEIICTGFYRTNKKRDINGCFVATVNRPSGEINQAKLDFGETEFKNMYERSVILQPDGSIALIAEQFKLKGGASVGVPIPNTSASFSNNKYIYNYENIVVVSISPDQKLNWTIEITKAQETKNDSGFYSSFYLLPTQNKLLFFYNDFGSFIKAKRPKAFKADVDKSMAVCVIVDAEGNAKKHKLFYTQSEQVFLRPKAFGTTSQGVLLIFTQQEDIQRYGKLQLRE